MKSTFIMDNYKDFTLKDLFISIIIDSAIVFAIGLIPFFMDKGYQVPPSAIFFGISACVICILLEYVAGNMLRSHAPAIIFSITFTYVIVMLVVSLIMQELILWSFGLSLIFFAFVVKYLLRSHMNFFIVYGLVPIAILSVSLLDMFLPKDYGVIMDLVAFGVVNLSILLSIVMLGLPYCDNYLYRFQKGSTKKRILPTYNDSYSGDEGDPSELEWLIKNATYAYSVSVYEHGNTIDVDMSISSESAHMASVSKDKARSICNKWARKNNKSYSFNIRVTID